MRFYVGLAFVLAAAALLAGTSHMMAATRPISHPTDGGPGDRLARGDASNGANSGRAYADNEKTPAAADSDFDGVIDYDDNCPSNHNPNQEDGDGDGLGDACDACPNTASGDPVNGFGCSTADDDGDGVLNDQDECPQTATGDPIDVSGCSTADDDADGVLNDQDDCPDTPSCADVDSDGCPLDGDDDGVPDGCDNCPDVANTDQADADADSVGDACDQPSCCGGAGPVAPLGLMIGMILLSRFTSYRGKARYPATRCSR